MDGIETSARVHALKRIMVLPFRMLRPSEEFQFLAYSLPEAITVSLAGLENLVVRSSIVASRFSTDALDLQRIAREAEVNVVLTGALLNVGDSTAGYNSARRGAERNVNLVTLLASESFACK
jgi:TolB-like protein